MSNGAERPGRARPPVRRRRHGGARRSSGKGSSPTGTLERDAALEAQAIAASVIASDGRYSDGELRRSPSRCRPGSTRCAARRRSSCGAATPSVSTGRGRSRRRRCSRPSSAPTAGTGRATAGATTRPRCASRTRARRSTRCRRANGSLAVDTLRTMMLRRLAAAKVERPADMPRGVGEPEPLEDRPDAGRPARSTSCSPSWTARRPGGGEDRGAAADQPDPGREPAT